MNIDKTVIVNELFALHLAAVHLSPDVGRDFILTENKGYEIAYEKAVLLLKTVVQYLFHL
jgi:hypothetical protein